MKRQTKKQKLRTHIVSVHRRQPAVSWTEQQMAAWHIKEHHQFACSHLHMGANLGPGDRPAGWYTGEDVVPRDRMSR